jgi:2,5-diketo-D-gluconate reductase A
LFENEILVKIAEKYNKTVAQIMLRFFIQNNIIVIPKTSHIERMKENFEVFDFVLNEEDISEIKKLDQKFSYTNRPETMLKEQNY